MFDKYPRSQKSVFFKAKTQTISRLELTDNTVPGHRQFRFSLLSFQVLEYQPKDQSWVTIGNLEEIRGEGHAVLSIGPQDVLHCLAGKKPLEMNQ